jgi:hypothetical protein
MADTGGEVGGKPLWATFSSHKTRIELSSDIIYHNQPWKTLATVKSPFQYVPCGNIALEYLVRGRGRECFKHDFRRANSTAMCVFCLVEFLYRHNHLRSFFLVVKSEDTETGALTSSTTKRPGPLFHCHGQVYEEPLSLESSPLRKAQDFLDDLRIRYVSSCGSSGILLLTRFCSLQLALTIEHVKLSRRMSSFAFSLRVVKFGRGCTVGARGSLKNAADISSQRRTSATCGPDIVVCGGNITALSTLQPSPAVSQFSEHFRRLIDLVLQLSTGRIFTGRAFPIMHFTHQESHMISVLAGQGEIIKLKKAVHELAERETTTPAEVLITCKDDYQQTSAHMAAKSGQSSAFPQS